MADRKFNKRASHVVPLLGIMGLVLTGCVAGQDQNQGASNQLYEVYSPGSDVPHLVTADKVGGYANGQPQASMDQDDGTQDAQARHQQDVQQDLSNREFLQRQQGLQ